MFANLFQTLNHLPVTDIASSVADHFVNQLIPIVTSEVASGKTMLLPAHIAERLKDDPLDQIVYVLEPTRFLANNAAESLRSLLGKEGENLVGCINSNRSDDESLLHPSNRIIFTTVGYALSSGILKTRNNFILDEAHELSTDLSLTKAYLHHRLENGDLINVAVLSATIDETNEMDYWGDAAVHFTTKGSAFPVEYLHRPAFSLSESVLTLITEHDRTGIVVFVSGVEEISEATQDIGTLLSASGIDYEIAPIHGNSTGEQRRAASRQRRTDVKILIGTNVLESGVSLPWVDAGVSSGDTKVMHVNGNVRKLNKEELPQWRINQQMGRVARFKPGVFILAHSTAIEYRPEMSLPDIARLPLTELVMHCTNFPDIHIHDLKFTAREQPKPEAINKAIANLVHYGLIEEKADGRVVLTDEGRLIQTLPLSYRAAVAYCEAYKLKMVAEMLPLIAMIDIGDLRFNYKLPMIGAAWTTSDPVFQIMTLVQFFMGRHDLTRGEMREMAEYRNVNMKKVNEFELLLRDLEKKTNTHSNFTFYYPKQTNAERDEFDRLTKQVIFRSMMAETYPFVGFAGSVRIPVTVHGGATFTSAKMSQTTACSLGYPERPLMCAGNVRVITPKRGVPFAVLDTITSFNKTDVKLLIKCFGKAALQRVADISVTYSDLSTMLSNSHNRDDEEIRSDYEPGDYLDELFARIKPKLALVLDPDNLRDTETKAPEKTVSHFGDLLSAALKKK